MAARAGRTALLLLCAALATGCVPLSGGWSPDTLASLAASAALPDGHRLGDTPPHFWPQGDRVWLFLCRFETSESVRVALPPGATEGERRDLRLAFEIWQRAIPELRFREAPRETAQIVMLYDDAAGGGAPIAGAGLTVTDCEVAPPDGPIPDEGSSLDARLVRATIFLRRSNPDTIGREVPLSPDARLGAALHEIGHALGFGGHVGEPDSILSKTTDRMLWRARRLREGEPLDEPSVVALYALPNGLVVGETELSAQARADLTDAHAVAVERGWRGPFVRVGDRDAQLHYRRGEVMAGRLAVLDYPSRLRAGRSLEFSTTTLVRFTRARREARER